MNKIVFVIAYKQSFQSIMILMDTQYVHRCSYMNHEKCQSRGKLNYACILSMLIIKFSYLSTLARRK
jgi:hypothetical protein